MNLSSFHLNNFVRLAGLQKAFAPCNRIANQTDAAIRRYEISQNGKIFISYFKKVEWPLQSNEMYKDSQFMGLGYPIIVMVDIMH